MCVEAHCTVCDANLTPDGDCLACEDRMIAEMDAAEYCPADDGDMGFFEEYYDDQPEWMN